MSKKIKNMQVVIYAAGADGRSLFHALKRERVTTEFFIDINADKIVHAEDVPVYKPDNMPDTFEPKSAVVYISLGNSRFFSDALSTLSTLGFTDIRDGIKAAQELNKAHCKNLLKTSDYNISAANCLNCNTKYHECSVFQHSVTNGRVLERTEMREIPTVSLQVTSRCPHRCKDCVINAPYIKPVDFDMDLLLADINAFLTNTRYLFRLALGGGEIFLHKQLADLITHLLNDERICSLQIASTGVITPDERLLNILDDPRISFSISSYGNFLTKQMARKTDTFIKQLEDRNKPFRFNRSIVWYDFGDGSLKQRPEKAHKAVFGSCELRKECNIIWDGKLYHCSKTHTLNEMGMVPSTEADYVDLRNPHDLEDRLRAFYNQTMLNTCRYCNGTSNSSEIPAGIQLET